MHSIESLQKLIKNRSTDYIYTVRIENGIPVETRHGETCVNVTGYCAQDFIDNPWLWIQMVLEEDHRLVHRQAEQILSLQCASPVQHRIIRKDGAIRWVESSVVPGYAPDGSLQSYYGIVRDITERSRDIDEQLNTIDALINQADALLVKSGTNESDSGKVPVQTNKEKRAYKRFPTGKDCWAEMSDTGRLLIKDISMGGICLITDRQLPLDSWHQIKIISGREREISSTGVVIWSEFSREKSNGRSHYETGLKITGMNDRLKSSLGRFVLNNAE